ncbi:MAG TPA: BACON domain-containing protein [Terracidiphilus sp.]|jgi:hypothetical protein
MRLRAKVELVYAAKVWPPGSLFDAPESYGRQLISRDEAEPFNLEDPSTRTLADAIENLQPPPPVESSVSLSPTGAIPAAAGGSDLFRVNMTGEGMWAATTDTPWITIDSPTTPQTQSGDVHYTVAPNFDPAVRAADITVNSEAFTVTQAASSFLP